MESSGIETKSGILSTRAWALSQPQVVLLLHVLIAHLNLIFSFGWFTDAASLALGIWSVRLKNWPLIHLTLVMMLFRRMNSLLPDFVANFFALYLFIVLAISYAILAICKKTSTVRAWLKRGQINRTIVFEMIGVSLVAAAALILWGLWTDDHGAADALMKGLAGIPRPMILAAAIPGFALLNAFSEEALFRGVFQEAALKAKFNDYAAMALQAMPFAAFHVIAGFPNGKLGYAMTFIYACALGFLRKQTKGLLAPYLTHVTADLVIAYFIFYSAT